MMSKPEIKLVSIYDALPPSFSATVNDVGGTGSRAILQHGSISAIGDVARVRRAGLKTSLRRLHSELEGIREVINL